MFLPKIINKVRVPPIKCQGIKTKLIDFISQSIKWDGNGIWIEPFLGSGVVLFNIQPERALVSDTNKHIINLYNAIKDKKINSVIVKEFLNEMNFELQKGGQEFYNSIRDRFNKHFDILDFLFLNRSCFNGMMRFNSRGLFNVPFGHKPQRFRQSYITKIINQINWIYEVMKDKDWEFKISDWKKILEIAKENDFVYLDPPYIGRHTDYYNNWSENEAKDLVNTVKQLKSGFAMSMWLENKYRRNNHIDEFWDDYEIRTFSHFYHVGPSENLRNEMKEVLIMSNENAVDVNEIYTYGKKYKVLKKQYELTVSDKARVKEVQKGNPIKT